jgi:hypothetical protein
MNCVLRSFALKQVNKLLEGYRDDVDKARQTVVVWTGRAKALTACLESLSKKLEDGKIDEDELTDAIDEIKTLVKGWK